MISWGKSLKSKRDEERHLTVPSQAQKGKRARHLDARVTSQSQALIGDRMVLATLFVLESPFSVVSDGPGASL